MTAAFAGPTKGVKCYACMLADARANYFDFAFAIKAFPVQHFDGGFSIAMTALGNVLLHGREGFLEDLLPGLLQVHKVTRIFRRKTIAIHKSVFINV